MMLSKQAAVSMKAFTAKNPSALRLEILEFRASDARLLPLYVGIWSYSIGQDFNASRSHM